MKAWITLLFGSLWLALVIAPAQAAVPLASPEEEQYAKLAIPAYGSGLLYIYRAPDGVTKATPAIWINARESGKLDPNTFGWWSVRSGKMELRAGQADAKPLTIQSEEGKTYFVQMVVKSDGSVSLAQVQNEKGMKEIQSARLILAPTAAAGATVVTTDTQAKAEEKKEQQKSDEYGVTLTFKLGLFLPSDKSQTIDFESRKLDGTSVIYGLQGEWRHETGLAVGLELFTHKHGYKSTTSAETGDVDLSYAILNLKYYFDTRTLMQPYIGVGVGRTVADFSGGISGSVDSNALQGVAGVNFRWKYVDLYTEYKYLHDEFILGGKVQGTGNALLLGVSSHF